MAKADLYPLSFSALVDRLDREVARGEAIYSLPRRDFWVPSSGLDLGMHHMAGRAATPLGPASGPHTQLAQNIVIGWLAGARFFELKTVQILDTLEIPRPCIFVPNIGYNVEWSQELRVEQSGHEYVKAWWLVHMLASEHGPGLWPGDASDTIFDISVGYDLPGIQSEKVTAFIESMKDASHILDELKGEIATRFPRWAGVAVPAKVSASTTLSTFHGCPAEQIEAIASHMLVEHGLHTVIKLNPTLLGYDRVRKILDDKGYGHVELHRSDFDKDLSWAQLMDFLPRLEKQASERGLHVGVKFTNTLVCKSADPPFGQGEMYLSGPPLHVIAMTLADEFRRATSGRFDISFSAGIDADNFPDAVACGLKPVTTCSDLLKGRGYAKLSRYLKNLEVAMHTAGADSVESFVSARADGADTPATVVLEKTAAATRADPRYARAANDKPPKKVGSHLALLDCLTCDKCIHVCPNLANVTVEVEQGEWALGTVKWSGDARTIGEGPALKVEKRHQIGNVADLCNLCGQCDPWCPEDGGPYIEKPHLFLSEAAFAEHPELDGFMVSDDGQAIRWRYQGALYRYHRQGGDTAILETESGTLTLENGAPVSSSGEGEVALRIPKIMSLYLDGFTHASRELFVEISR